MNLDEPLSAAEIEELETALISEAAPADCMDVSMLDGFLTCLAIGPEDVAASRWLPRVWGEGAEGQAGFSSVEAAERVVSLIVRLQNTIVRMVDGDLQAFSPILYSGSFGDRETTIIDEWCMGFMHGVELCGAAWAPLFDSEEANHLLAPMFHHGTEQGWKQLEEEPELAEIEHEEWVEMLLPSVAGLREFWARRGDEAPPPEAPADGG